MSYLSIGVLGGVVFGPRRSLAIGFGIGAAQLAWPGWTVGSPSAFC
jgi:hypothetical protein